MCYTAAGPMLINRLLELSVTVESSELGRKNLLCLIKPAFYFCKLLLKNSVHVLALVTVARRTPLEKNELLQKVSRQIYTEK